jgi:hypothetical protein
MGSRLYKEISGAQVAIIDMTSQTWRSAAEVDRPSGAGSPSSAQGSQNTTSLLFITSGA